MARYDIVEAALSRAFYTYGKMVYRRKLFFLLASLLLMLVSLSGFLHFEINEDVHKMFTPANSESYGDLEVLKEHFLSGGEGTEFLPNRKLAIMNKGSNVVITARPRINLMTKEVMKEILDLDEHLRSYAVDLDVANDPENEPSSNRTIKTTGTYNDLCMKWQTTCVDNAWLRYIGAGLEDQDILLNLTYPFSTFGSHSLSLGPLMSRVVTHQGTDIIKDVEVIMLSYSLSRNDEIGDTWEAMFEEHVDEFQETCKYIELSRGNSESLSKETKEAGIHVMPRFVATFLLMVVFSVVACMMWDRVLSKPWLGFLGVVSACLAIITTFGLMSYVTQFNVLVALMPFVVLGVGIDNMFIFISTWRQSNPQLAVEERVGRTLSGAAVSVTITNLTDVLAFMVGSTVKLPSIKVFCAYAGVAMVFVYIYQMTFFAACLAYDGDREAKKLNFCTCKRIRPREQTQEKVQKLGHSGDFSNRTSQAKLPENFLTKFFRVWYGPFLVKPVVKFTVVIGYLAYIAGAVYGCTRISTGMKLKACARDYSPAWVFFDEIDRYFTEYGPSVSIVFEGPIDYWEEETQNKLLGTLDHFIDSDYIFDDDRLTWAWMRDFQEYLRMSGTISTNESHFHHELGEFLEDPRFRQYALDIDLERTGNDTITGVAASRFLVTSRNMSTTDRQSEMMLEMRELAEESEFSMIVFGPYFVVYEQYVGVVPITLKTLSFAILCMFAVSIVMIPHPICAVFVTVCVVSIDGAVIGYMSLLGVPLSPISLTNIILCIGFSVDFAAHITYGFVIAPNEDPDLRAVSALGSLGMPILQGAMSTILAISVLSTASVYLFRIFFTILFLVMVFGAAHGLIFLPVGLSFVGKWMPHKVGGSRDSQAPTYSSISGAIAKSDQPCKQSLTDSWQLESVGRPCVVERVSTV